MKKTLWFLLVASALLSLAAAVAVHSSTTRHWRTLMHSLAVKLAAVRAARRVRNAEQVHALWQERRRRDTPAYAFGAAIRWHAA